MPGDTIQREIKEIWIKKNNMNSVGVSGAKKHGQIQQAVGNASLSLNREIRVDNWIYHAENKYDYERMEC